MSESEMDPPTPVPSLDPRALERAAAAFGLDGVTFAPLGNGHINETYAVDSVPTGSETGERWVLQRINGSVFARPDQVMDNLVRITDHLREVYRGREEEGRRPPETLSIVPTVDGRVCHVDETGATWRLVARVARAHSIERVGSDDEAFRLAHAFGSFAADLSQMQGPALVPTIPGFHDFAGRVKAFAAAVADDAVGRAAAAGADVAHAEELVGRIGGLLASVDAAGLVPRAMHNDAKINNVMVDDASGVVVCVLDLDTTMPGPVYADLGELVRTGATAAAEDETDLDAVVVDDSFLQALVRGYLVGVGDTLAAAERAVMVYAGPVMAVENAIRFLADHIAGDPYYPIDRPGHNLDRARTQLFLADRLLERTDLVRVVLADG